MSAPFGRRLCLVETLEQIFKCAGLGVKEEVGSRNQERTSKEERIEYRKMDTL